MSTSLCTVRPIATARLVVTAIISLWVIAVPAPASASPGTMTITGDYSLDSGDLFVELAGLGAGTGYDQLIVTGDVSLAGDLTLDVGFTPGLGDTFTIIDNQGANAISGAFTQGSTIFAGGHTFGITYGGGDGNDVVLVVRDVPEPATALLVALGVLFVAGGRRLAAVQRRHG